MGKPAVVLVEGASDKLALEALAARRGADLEASEISVIAIGGSKNFGAFVQRYGPLGANVKLAGLYDTGEENDIQRGLERAGFGSSLTRSDLERHGFYACDVDLEDELIRALGVAKIEQLIDTMGELGALRTFQKQLQWRDRTAEEQLRRWFGAHASMKVRAAPLLVHAFDLDRVPRPLERVLAHVGV